MTITREDVARLANVSTATVSYVINGGPRPVSATARTRVLQAIEQLGYRPNIIARSLTTKRTHTVGFIIPDILNPVHASIAKSFEQAMLMAGYSVILCNSDEMPDRELGYLQVLHSKQVDAIALTPTGENRPALTSLMAAELPLVLLDRQLEGLRVDTVLFDNEVGAFQGTRHLLDLGHRQIGLINLPITLTPGWERLQGYRRALLEVGMRVNPAFIREGNFKESGEALAESLLSMQPHPTALLVSSNRLMGGVLTVVKRHLLRVPDDIAICVFDDVSHYPEFTPSITAIGASIEQFGGEAARLLTERMRQAFTGEPRTIRIPCQLHVRESTVGMKVRVNGTETERVAEAAVQQ